MRVFVTEAASFIGLAIVQELLEHGHQVLGLARSDASIEAVTHAGAEPHEGDLKDSESLKRGAKAADGVIHLVFPLSHTTDMWTAQKVDFAAVAVLGEILAGTGKPLVIASSTLDSPLGEIATEEIEPQRRNQWYKQGAQSADMVYALSKQQQQVRGSVIRLPPIVHGAGDAGLIPQLIKWYCDPQGCVIQTAEGSGRLPAVHRDDVAVLFRLALEKGTPGATYNAVAEQGVSQKEINALIVKHTWLPLVEIGSINDVVASCGAVGQLLNISNPTLSERTRKELGWEPTQPGLLADMETNYFSEIVIPREFLWRRILFWLWYRWQ